MHTVTALNAITRALDMPTEDLAAYVHALRVLQRQDALDVHLDTESVTSALYTGRITEHRVRLKFGTWLEIKDGRMAWLFRLEHPRAGAPIHANRLDALVPVITEITREYEHAGRDEKVRSGLRRAWEKLQRLMDSWNWPDYGRPELRWDPEFHGGSWHVGAFKKSDFRTDTKYAVEDFEPGEDRGRVLHGVLAKTRREA